MITDDIVRAVLSATASATTMAAFGDGLARALGGRIAFDRLNVGRLDMAAYVFHDVYVTGRNVAGRATGHVRPLDGSVVEAAIRAGGGFAFGDADETGWLARFPRFGPVFASGIRAMLAVSLGPAATPHAALVLASVGPAAYGPAEVALMRAVGAAVSDRVADLAGGAD